MTDPFYRAFEDKHRGSRDLIKARLTVYLPFVCPLASLHPAIQVLDLGCGRGEWLELLQDNGVAAQGVDLDQGMLAACRERGLPATCADALTYLGALPDHSQLAVTGFHIAEHLPFAVLQTLFAQARRVLVPGGLLILETPNPENLVVGTANFYIDPTHQRPLPAQLLSFLAEYHGFGRVKLLRLQAEERVAVNGPAGLYDVLGNASPDYAIVAQSDTTKVISHALEQAFSADYGVSLYALAGRYDQSLQEPLHRLQQLLEQQLLQQSQQQAQQLQQQAQQLEAMQRQLGVQLLATQSTMQQAQEALAVALQNGARADQFAADLSAMHASQSWRLTRPLRWLAQLFRGSSG